VGLGRLLWTCAWLTTTTTKAMAEALPQIWYPVEGGAT